MHIRNIIVGVIHTNSYLLIDDETNISAVVDPGFNADKLIEEIDKTGTELKYIILTHAHFDHCYEASIIKEHYNAKIICNALSKEVAASDDYNQSMSFMHKHLDLKLDDNDIYLNDNDEFDIGSLHFKMIYVGGHTLDSSAYYNKDQRIVITGDTLFFESVGRSDLPGGDSELLFDNLENKILALPDNTRVLPGHGPETNIGHEKVYNEYI